MLTMDFLQHELSCQKCLHQISSPEIQSLPLSYTLTFAYLYKDHYSVHNQMPVRSFPKKDSVMLCHCSQTVSRSLNGKTRT